MTLGKIELENILFNHIIYDILGLLVNMSTASYEYSCSNRDNLPLPTQIKFSKKR